MSEGREPLTLIIVSYMCTLLRNRPFNLKGGGGYGFLFRSEFFFSDNTRVRIFIFFVAQSATFFFQNVTLGYMTKTLNQIIFFSSTKIRIFFSATLGIRIFFSKKNIPHPPFKLNGRSLKHLKICLVALMPPSICIKRRFQVISIICFTITNT